MTDTDQALGQLRETIYSDRITRRERLVLLGSLLRRGDKAALTLVSTTIATCKGNVAESARRLGLSTRSFWRLVGSVRGLQAAVDGARAGVESEDGRPVV